MKEYDEYELTNKTTGEIISTTKVEIKEGTRVGINTTTENQRETYKNHQEDIEEYKEFNSDAYFHLIFKYGTIIFRELEEKAPGSKCNIHIIRFIILASHITFNGNLLDKNGHRIKKSSLKKIWDTENRNGVNETYNLLSECGYIYETEEGYVMINEDMVIKGVITEYIKELKKQDSSYTFTRIYIDNVKAMYYNTEPKQRKQLANLFKALPYINFKYNVFCANPTETDAEKVDVLTWTDLAKLCGYDDKKQVARFKKDLMNLNISNHGVIGQFTHGSAKIICINPRLYYSSHDTAYVEGLQNLFDWADKMNK